jgi:hypothetical protein
MLKRTLCFILRMRFSVSMVGRLKFLVKALILYVFFKFKMHFRSFARDVFFWPFFQVSTDEIISIRCLLKIQDFLVVVMPLFVCHMSVATATKISATAKRPINKPRLVPLSSLSRVPSVTVANVHCVSLVRQWATVSTTETIAINSRRACTAKKPSRLL